MYALYMPLHPLTQNFLIARSSVHEHTLCPNRSNHNAKPGGCNTHTLTSQDTGWGRIVPFAATRVMPQHQRRYPRSGPIHFSIRPKSDVAAQKAEIECCRFLGNAVFVASSKQKQQKVPKKMYHDSNSPPFSSLGYSLATSSSPLLLLLPSD